jgi:hypothetical protein
MVARTAFVPGQTNHVALMNQLVGMRNLLINGAFIVNQRGYVSGAVLAAGAYGVDRWKAGAAGGDFTFATWPTTVIGLVILPGKSLIQVVEDKNVFGGQYVLSWLGTAQARYGVNSAVPSGAYASSPIVISGQTMGTTMSVEFNAGTVAYAQLELATADPTDFEVRHFATELQLCQRYFWKTFPYATPVAQNSGTVAGALAYIVHVGGGTAFDSVPVHFPCPMRAAPTVTFYNPNAANAKWRNTNLAADSSTSAAGTLALGDRGFTAQNQQVAGDLAGHTIVVHAAADAEL